MLLVNQGRTAARRRFVSLGRDHNILVIQEHIRREPVAISFRVVNHSSLPIEIGAELHELGWLPVPEIRALAQGACTVSRIAP